MTMSAVTAADYGGSLPLVSVSCPDAGEPVKASDIRAPVAALLAETDDIRTNATTGLANKLNRDGDTSTGLQTFAAGATVSSGQDLTLDGASVQGTVGFSSLGEVLFYGRKAWFRNRVALSDADHSVNVSTGDRFNLPSAGGLPTAPRNITAEHTTIVPDYGETMTFFWFPGIAAVGVGAQYRIKREDASTIATFAGAQTVDTGLVWAEIEYTSTGWQLGKNSGTLYDYDLADYYGVIKGT
jgi:hypothetical protein